MSIKFLWWIAKNWLGWIKKKNRYDKRKIKLYNTVSELYDKRFDNYYDEYNKLSDVKK